MSNSGLIDVPAWGVERLPVHRFSVADYWAMVSAGIIRNQERVELLEGCVIPMSPHRPPHDGTVTLVQQALEPLLPANWFIRIQSAIETEDSAPEPDLVIVRGPARRYLDRHPVAADMGLIVEVADTTLEIDRRIKSRIYARAGIPVYWIANIPEACIEVHSQPQGGRSPRYRQVERFVAGQSVPISLGRRRLGEIHVADLL